MVSNQMLLRLDYRQIMLQLSKLCSVQRSYFSNSTLMKDSKKFRRFQSKIRTTENVVPFKFKEAFIQTIGSGAYGAPGSLLVQSHYYRFLFNCGDETKRLLREIQLSNSYFKRVFITSCTWNHVSGLSGMMHEAQETKFASVRKAYGPSGLKRILKNYADFYAFADHSETCFEIEEENLIFEESLIVKSVPIYPTRSNIQSSKENNNLKYVLAYICTFPSTTGVLSPLKLVNASVPAGPLIECLRKGVPIKLPDGTTVTPSEVSDFCHHSSSFIVLDIPDFEFLEGLLSTSAFDKYRKDKSKDNPEENDLEVIVHLSPKEVMLDSRYRQWINSFPPSVSHLVINDRSSCLGLSDPVRFQLQLNTIRPKIFPLHRNPGVPLVTSGTDISTQDLDPSLIAAEYKFNGSTVQSNTYLKFMFRPSVQFKSSSELSINPVDAASECLQEEGVLNSLKELHEKFDELDRGNDQKCQSSYPNILFLGTGSSVGSSLRSNSSILLTLSPEACVMLDCGFHTFNQLIRLLDKEETFSTLRKLKLIFISHLHQDHFWGLTTIFAERRKAFLEAGVKTPPPLYVLAPPDVIRFLYGVHGSLNTSLENIKFHNNVLLCKGPSCNGKLFKITSDLKLESIQVVFVPHCKYSCGIALNHTDGWKIVYSGDCSPSKNLIDIGENCDLLIHEATFLDGEVMGNNSHCTTSEALKVGRDMNAKFTILTHFSLMYKKVPFIEESAALKQNFGIAFDCMQVTLQDLPYVRHMYPALKEMFYEDYEKNVERKYRNTLLKKLNK